MSKDQRAYELLQWQAIAPLSDFDDLYPYAELWKPFSDKALDQFEKDNPYETSEELAAFRELERLGVFTQSDFFSPTKAKEGFYARRLREHIQLRERREKGGKQKHRGVAPARRYRG